MSKSTTGVVQDVEIRGPYTSKTGNTFDVHVLTVNGVDYAQFKNSNAEAEVQQGDEVAIIFDEQETARGTSRKIAAKGLKVLKSGGTSTMTSIPITGTASAARGKNELGAQIGNALNVAANTLGGEATMKQLETRAREVLALSEKLRSELENR